MNGMDNRLFWVFFHLDRLFITLTISVERSCTRELPVLSEVVTAKLKFKETTIEAFDVR